MFYALTYIPSLLLQYRKRISILSNLLLIVNTSGNLDNNNVLSPVVLPSQYQNPSLRLLCSACWHLHIYRKSGEHLAQL